jgi:hypothetical protein
LGASGRLAVPCIAMEDKKKARTKVEKIEIEIELLEHFLLDFARLFSTF